MPRILSSLRSAIEKYLIVWLFFGCFIAQQWPAWFGDTVVDPFVLGRYSLRYFIAVTMFSIGVLIPVEEVTEVARRWRAVLGGTAIQYAAMPALAYLTAHCFGLAEEWKIGLMIVGCVPGAMASNVLTMVARGNVSYSVSVTTCSTLLSPLMVPWLLKLTLLREIPDFPVWATFWELALTVVVPVLLGHCLTRNIRGLRRIMEPLSPIVANLTILWIIAVVVGFNRHQLGSITLPLLAALVVVNLAGYLAGYLGGVSLRLDAPMRKALTLEVGMQNAGLGAMLATELFGESISSLPSVLYTFGSMMTGTLLARVFAELADRARIARYTEELSTPGAK